MLVPMDSWSPYGTFLTRFAYAVRCYTKDHVPDRVDDLCLFPGYDVLP